MRGGPCGFDAGLGGLARRWLRLALRGGNAERGKRLACPARKRDRARGPHAGGCNEYKQKNKAQSRQADTYTFHRSSRMTTSGGRQLLRPQRPAPFPPGRLRYRSFLIANIG